MPSSTLSLATTVALRSGAQMPLFGLGTWLSQEGSEAKRCVSVALKLGYKLIDTAAMYENETSVGEALASSGLAREDIFVVTKLAGPDHGAEAAKVAIDASLKKLGLDYVDMWLIHSPKGGKILETWKSMLECRDAGKTKHVGVSNFGVAQLEGIAAAGLEAPMLNQIEYHFALQQRPTVDYCRAHSITLMGYCPLARRKLVGTTSLTAIAEKMGITEAQLAILWSAQTGAVTIPKSTNASRIQENAESLRATISQEDMAAIGELDKLAFKASGKRGTPWTSRGTRSSNKRIYYRIHLQRTSTNIIPIL